MKLNRLHNAWRIVRLQNNLDEISSEEILSLIAGPEDKVSPYSIWQNVLLFALLLLSCQGG